MIPFLVIIGILMIFSSVFLSYMDGINTEKEMEAWFIDKMMEHGPILRFLMISGVGFLGLAAAFAALRII